MEDLWFLKNLEKGQNGKWDFVVVVWTVEDWRCACNGVWDENGGNVTFCSFHGLDC